MAQKKNKIQNKTVKTMYIYPPDSQESDKPSNI